MATHPQTEKLERALVDVAYAMNTLLNQYRRTHVEDSTEKVFTIGYVEAKINQALRTAGVEEIDYSEATVDG